MTNIVLLSCVFLGIVATVSGSYYSPLPVFTKVSVDTRRARGGNSVIAVRYKAPERPRAVWFLDGFPIPEGRVDYGMVNHFEAWGLAILAVQYGQGKQFSVCLQNLVAESCLDLSPLPIDRNATETVEFPWPLLTPSPLAVYGPKEKLQIHAPELDTPHNYSYSVSMFSRNPLTAQGKMVVTSTNGMLGGQPNDIVTMRPDTLWGGWLLEVRTDLKNYEGVLLFNTQFVADSELVASCRTTRPLKFYRNGQRTAFPTGFVALINDDRPWRCKDGFDCVIVCPFVAKGEVEVNIFSMGIDLANPDADLVGALQAGIPGTVQRLGDYYGRAWFTLRDVRTYNAASTYVCQARTATSTAMGSLSMGPTY